MSGGGRPLRGLHHQAPATELRLGETQRCVVVVEVCIQDWLCGTAHHQGPPRGWLGALRQSRQAAVAPQPLHLRWHHVAPCATHAPPMVHCTHLLAPPHHPRHQCPQQPAEVQPTRGRRQARPPPPPGTLAPAAAKPPLPRWSFLWKPLPAVRACALAERRARCPAAPGHGCMPARLLAAVGRGCVHITRQHPSSFLHITRRFLDSMHRFLDTSPTDSRLSSASRRCLRARLLWASGGSLANACVDVGCT